MGAQAVRLSNVDIDAALKNKDFEVLFQPIFDLGNGALARVESFIRWRHPTLGVLPPGAFISFFENQGRMSELTRYVLAESLAAYQAWRGPFAPGFSINLATTDLADESFPSHFTVLLREYNFPAELITLECPMPAVDADAAAIARQLDRLADTGARLAIEVRGRANEFLRAIRPFPFAEIKTGGAAILRFARTVRGPGLSAISELLELANEQKAAITAVGVEDQASLAALRGLGFAAAQGNHLAKVGDLAQFFPSQVNDVRGLLGLEPLSDEELAALFRAGPPKLPAAPTGGAKPASPEKSVETTDEAPAAAAKPRHMAEPEADVVARLSKRIEKSAAPASADDGDHQRKAAAIARARRNTTAREKIAGRDALKEKAAALAEHAAPRDMQERLTREFESFSEDAPSAPAEVEAPQQETLASPARAEAPPPQARAAELALHVKSASARFSPIIRVSQPEAAALRPGTTSRLAAAQTESKQAAAKRAEELTTAPLAFATPIEPAMPIPTIDPVQNETAAQVEIPPAATDTQWIEETVAMAQTLRRKPAARKKQDLLRRRYEIRFSGYFWPRAIRRMFRRMRARAL